MIFFFVLIFFLKTFDWVHVLDYRIVEHEHTKTQKRYWTVEAKGKIFGWRAMLNDYGDSHFENSLDAEYFFNQVTGEYKSIIKKQASNES